MGTKGVWGASGATGCRAIWKEVAPMKRITFLLPVALVVALMLAVAGPALATVHPLANSECSGLDETTVAGSQDPPGLSALPFADLPAEHPNNSFNSDRLNEDGLPGNFAQPIFSVLAAQGAESPAFKQVPVPGSESFCPVE